MATRDHVRDLPAKAGSVKPEDGFAMVHETGRGAARTLGAMAKALANSGTLVLATDPDREGEAIAWQVPSWLRKQDVVGDRAVHQVAVHEVTPAGGAHGAGAALEHRHGLGRGLAGAPRARLPGGLRASRRFSGASCRAAGLPGCRSAGRVQSVALLLICEDEAEIEAFAPRAYWTVTADATATDGATLATGGTSGSGAPFRAELCRLDGAAIDVAGPCGAAIAPLLRRTGSGRLRAHAPRAWIRPAIAFFSGSGWR